MTLASGVPFNGLFLYVLSAPVFRGEHLGLAPTQFFWFFVLSMSGITSGAFISGRMADRLVPKTQIKLGFVIMMAMLSIGLVAWISLHRRWPQIGRVIEHPQG